MCSHAAMNLRPPSVTVSTHTSAFNAVASQSPAMPNARMSLCTQSVHYYNSNNYDFDYDDDNDDDDDDDDDDGKV